MRHLPTAALAAAAILVGAGCGATVRSSVAPSANLGRYHTFALQNPPSGPGEPISVADQDINAALRASLTARGYVEAPLNPDFIVSHQVKLQQQLVVNDWGYGYGWGFDGFGGFANAYTYTQGTLIVDFVDPKTNEAFWRGTASQILDEPSSPNSNKIQAAVEKMIKKYPATMAAVPRTTM